MGATPSHDQPPQNPLRSAALGPRPSNPYLPRTTNHPGFRPIESRPPVQQSGIVKNVISLSKSTLKLHPCEQDAHIHLITFEFDAEVDGWITIYYQAKEVITRDGVGEEAPVVKVGYLGKGGVLPVKTRFEKGRKQVYRQKVDRGLDSRAWSNADMKYHEGGNRYPIVVRLVADYPQEWDVPERLRVKSQTTFAEVVQQDDGSLQLAVIAQQVLVGGTIHRLLDLYGIGTPKVTAQENEGEGWKIDDNQECVICLTEPCNTAVLPCHHFCLCDDCARTLRNEADFQRRKCPVCRAELRGLLKIISNPKENSEESSSADAASTAAEGSTVAEGSAVAEGSSADASAPTVSDVPSAQILGNSHFQTHSYGSLEPSSASSSAANPMSLGNAAEGNTTPAYPHIIP